MGRITLPRPNVSIILNRKMQSWRNALFAEQSDCSQFYTRYFHRVSTQPQSVNFSWKMCRAWFGWNSLSINSMSLVGRLSVAFNRMLPPPLTSPEAYVIMSAIANAIWKSCHHLSSELINHRNGLIEFFPCWFLVFSAFARCKFHEKQPISLTFIKMAP